MQDKESDDCYPVAIVVLIKTFIMELSPSVITSAMLL